MIVIDGEYYCDVCNIILPENEIEKHKSGEEHEERRKVSDVIRAHKWVQRIYVISSST